MLTQAATADDVLVFRKKRGTALAFFIMLLLGALALVAVQIFLFNSQREVMRHGFRPGVVYKIVIVLPLLEALGFLILGAYHFHHFLSPPIILTLRPDGLIVRYRSGHFKNIAYGKNIPWGEIKKIGVTTVRPYYYPILDIGLRGTETFLAGLSPRALLIARRQRRQLGVPTDAPLSIVVPFAVLQTGQDDLMAQLHAYAQAHGVGEKVMPHDPVRIEMPLPPSNP